MGLVGIVTNEFPTVIAIKPITMVGTVDRWMGDVKVIQPEGYSVENLLYI